MTQPNPLAANHALFNLEYPQSLGVFNTYAEAQKAVDHLADQNFPVGNLAIVGTDLRLVERVTGRRTWGTVLGQGVMSGLSTGFIVAIFMMVLFPTEQFLAQLLTALVIGVVIGLLFSVLGYVLSRGQRDFTSVSQTVATKYELLCEHKVVSQARELLASVPGARMAAFNQGQGWTQQQATAPQGYPQQGFPQQGYPQQPAQQGYPQQPPVPPTWGQQPWTPPAAAPQQPTAPQASDGQPWAAPTPPSEEEPPASTPTDR